MDKAYLSIDLDFWKSYKSSRSSLRFFHKVFALNVPIIFVIEHEELLRNINRSKANILYNIDYHSDICSDGELYEDEKVNDGNWVNYVSWRRKGKYIWICPDYHECYENESGSCHSEEQCDPFEHKLQTPWKETEVTDQLRMIEWEKITKVGVCLSPCYVCPGTVKGVTKKLGMTTDEVYDLYKNQSESAALRKRGTLFKVA